MTVLTNLVTFALSLWLEISLALYCLPDTYPKFVFLSQCTDSIVMNFTKSFGVVTSDLYLVYFVPQRDLCMLCCMLRIELIITEIMFTKLWCA